MAGQTSFCRLATSNFRNLFISRPSIINSPHVAHLRIQSKELLKGVPEKPKKPMVAFFLFSEARRNQLKKDHPNAKIGELAKILSYEWKNMEPSIKEKYETMYKNAKIEYAKKTLEYNTTLTESQKISLEKVAEEKRKHKEHKIMRKTLKEMNKPKRPVGAYIYFLKEYFNKNRDKFATFPKFMNHSKEIWESLPPEERIKFNYMYLDDKKRYEIEMEAWEAEMISLGRSDLVRHRTNLMASKPTRPIKPIALQNRKQTASSAKPTNTSETYSKLKSGKSE